MTETLKPLNWIKLFEITGFNNADEIRDAVKGVTRPVETVAVLPKDIKRPICYVCHQPIGRLTCKVTIQRKEETS